MKKIFALIAGVIIALAMLAGCDDSAQVNSDTAVTSESGEGVEGDELLSPDDYDKTFDGFVKYMSDNGFIKGDGTDLTASAIGAEQGKRFTVSSGTSKFYVELYEYTDQTSELAAKTIQNARTDGSFHLFDSTESATQNTLAAVSEDGSFLMLYTDSSTNENNISTKELAAKAVANFSK